MRVLIVGGGAAGLCCAIRLRQLDPALQVTVLERLEQPGKKLLATGNGRCNLTNMQAPHSRAVLDFFASLGLMTRQEDLGRVYPYSCGQPRCKICCWTPAAPWACAWLPAAGWKRSSPALRCRRIRAPLPATRWWWPAAGRHNRHWAAMAAAMPCCKIWPQLYAPVSGAGAADLLQQIPSQA